MVAPPAPSDWPTILEIKRTLDGREKRFDCRLIAGDGGHAVVLFVAPAAMLVHGVDLPKGTVTFGYFWSDRLYNVYHWLDPRRGTTIGFYFNLADRTLIGDGRLEWRDLTVDILATPAGRLEVLDEHELPADLDEALRARIAEAKRQVFADLGNLIRELELSSRSFFQRVFPEAAPAKARAYE
jgi:predicted RNA-binding protein associated with RNAse of E/G family